MTNPLITLTTSTNEDSFARVVDDEVPLKGGEVEAPHDREESEGSRKGEESEVPPRVGEVKAPNDGEESEVSMEGKESEVPYEGGNNGSHEGSDDDKAPADGQLAEDPTHVDAEAGPSGVQHQLVVQQAVTEGDEPPELCAYEKLRERNIRERDKGLKEAMEEIEEAKQDMRDNAPGAKRAAEEEAGGMRKRKKVEPVVEVRRSGRERKPVTCVVDEDLDGRSRKRRRKVGDGRSTGVSKTPVRSGGVKNISNPSFLLLHAPSPHACRLLRDS